MASKHLIISGRVQGVYFRDSCRSQAQALGVAGWVRNLPDRTVEAHLEGPRQAVERLIAWARQGPAAAVVTGVEVTDAAAEPGAGDGFAVLPTPAP